MSNQCGICEWSLPVTGPSSIELASRIGFDGIQLGDLGGAAHCFPMNDHKLQSMYLEYAERFHVQIQSYHLMAIESEGGLQCLPDSEGGRSVLRSIRNGFEVCRDMKIPVLMITSYNKTAIINEYDVECTAKTLREAVKMGENYGVRLVYESIVQLKYIQQILDFAGPSLKLCYDILNPIKFLKGDPVEEIHALGRDRIDHVHLKDTGHEMKGFCQLGTGRWRFAESIQALRDIGFDGWYITENFYTLPPMGEKSFFDTAEIDLQTMRGL